MLGDRHARPGHYERRDGGNIKRARSVSPRAAHIDCIRIVNPDPEASFPHNFDEAEKLLFLLAFYFQSHQEPCDLRVRGLPVHNRPHRRCRLLTGEVLARGGFLYEFLHDTPIGAGSSSSQ